MNHSCQLSEGLWQSISVKRGIKWTPHSSAAEVLQLRARGKALNNIPPLVPGPRGSTAELTEEMFSASVPAALYFYFSDKFRAEQITAPNPAFTNTSYTSVVTAADLGSDS